VWRAERLPRCVPRRPPWPADRDRYADDRGRPGRAGREPDLRGATRPAVRPEVPAGAGTHRGGRHPALASFLMPVAGGAVGASMQREATPGRCRAGHTGPVPRRPHRTGGSRPEERPAPAIGSRESK
jgi:hypothetical protein